MPEDTLQVLHWRSMVVFRQGEQCLLCAVCKSSRALKLTTQPDAANSEAPSPWSKRRKFRYHMMALGLKHEMISVRVCSPLARIS